MAWRKDRPRLAGTSPDSHAVAPGEAGMVTAEIAVALPAVVLVLLLVLSAVSAGDRKTTHMNYINNCRSRMPSSE